VPRIENEEMRISGMKTFLFMLFLLMLVLIFEFALLPLPEIIGVSLDELNPS
jgi:hypothetical protein